MTYPFRYDEQAAIEAILYVSRRVSDRTLMRICKILYLADKLHLERYGRFIFGDTYYALEHGPVPSKAYREM